MDDLTGFGGWREREHKILFNALFWGLVVGVVSVVVWAVLFAESSPTVGGIYAPV